MISPDKKKAASAILSRMSGPKVEDTAPENESNDQDGALKAIAGDMLQAVSDKSEESLVSALKAFLAEYELGEE